MKLDDLIGTPFKNNGRDIKSGLDCYGLVMEVFSRYGIEIPEYWSDYDNAEKISGIIHEEATSSRWQRVNEPLPVPCLVAIRFGVPAPCINHTVVYIGNGKFIHIREKTGVVIENIHSVMWRHVIEGFFTFVGDADGTDRSH